MTTVLAVERAVVRAEQAAVRDILPVAASVAPFALVIGVTMREMGVPAGSGVTGGALMYGGSAQLAALALIESGAGFAMILAAVAMINARLLVYGAALEPSFRGQPRWFRWLGPQFVVDQTYALATRRDDLGDAYRFRRYWLTAGLVLGAIWLAAMAAGVGLGPLLPEASPLDFAATAVIVGLLAPQLRAPRPVVVAGVAGVVAVLGADLPGGLGLAAGMVAGMAAGALSEVIRA